MWGPGYLSSTAAQHGNDPVETLHRQFLRRLLGDRPSTPNLIIYSEFGRYPLRYHWRKRIYASYKRLARIAAKGHRYTLAAAFRDNLNLAATQQASGTPHSQHAWMGKVATFMDTCGISIDLTDTGAATTPMLKPCEVESKGRLEHLQQLATAIGTKMEFYKQKIRGWDQHTDISSREYIMQRYLKTPMPWLWRRDLSRFRTSSHYLEWKPTVSKYRAHQDIIVHVDYAMQQQLKTNTTWSLIAVTQRWCNCFRILAYYSKLMRSQL